MSHSEYDSNDETISAYLDGELAGPECDRIEQLLESNEDYRQTYQDLKSLQGELKSLPRHTLDNDFYLKVLHRITELPAWKPSPNAIFKKQPLGTEPKKFQPLWSRHGILWPLAAIAATVLIAAFIYDGFHPDHDVELAKAPGESSEPDASAVPMVEGTDIETKKGITELDTARRPHKTAIADLKRDEQAVETSNIAVESVVEAMGENRVDAIIQVNLAQAGIGNRAFDESLSRNQIVYDTSSSSSASHLAARSASKPAEVSPKIGKGGSAGYGGGISKPAASPLSNRSSQLQNHQLVYVEAPVEQIQATVKDLEKDIQQFPEVKLYLSNQLDQASLDQLGIDRASQTNIAAQNKISQMQRADQFYFLDTSRQFVQQVLQPEKGKTQDPLSQNLGRPGRAQRILVDELAAAEGEYRLQREADPAYQWNAPGLAGQLSAEQSSPEKRSHQSFGDRPKEPHQQQSNELANAAQFGRSLQVLFILTPNQMVQNPSAESATMEEPSPP